MDIDITNFFGMHFIWWIIWAVLLFWVYITPYNIPGQRMKKTKPNDLLKKRLAVGSVTIEEYTDMKRLLESDQNINNKQQKNESTI
jgi:putative membrane protein